MGFWPQAAILESSKVFSRTMKNKYTKPDRYSTTVRMRIVRPNAGCSQADGLVSVRSPHIPVTRPGKSYGGQNSAGQRIVVEEYIIYPEVSVLALRWKPLSPCQRAGS